MERVARMSKGKEKRYLQQYQVMLLSRRAEETEDSSSHGNVDNAVVVLVGYRLSECAGQSSTNAPHAVGVICLMEGVLQKQSSSIATVVTSIATV